MSTGWTQVLYNSIADGPALANTTTATSLLNGVDKWVLGAGQSRIYTGIRIEARGRASNIVTTPGTLTLSLRTVGGVVLANGGAMALNVAAKTNVSWQMELLLTCRAVGSGTAANFMFQGSWQSESVVGAAAGVAGTIMLPASAPAVGGGFDSSAAQQIDLFGAWSIANAGNSIQVHQYYISLLN